MKKEILNQLIRQYTIVNGEGDTDSMNEEMPNEYCS